MSDVRPLQRALVERILGDRGAASRQLRLAAFNDAGLDEPLRTLVGKVALNAYKVTDEDIAAARAAGLSENQIYEIVVCAAVGQATRQYESGLAALDAAVGKG